jgi:hypothetical protein
MEQFGIYLTIAPESRAVLAGFVHKKWGWFPAILHVDARVPVQKRTEADGSGTWWTRSDG